MSYLAQSRLVEDLHLVGRVSACAATQGITDVRVWASANMWALSASTGWADAYAAAMASEQPVDPAAYAPVAGADPNVITDQMILAAVQKLRAEETKAPSE